VCDRYDVTATRIAGPICDQLVAGILRAATFVGVGAGVDSAAAVGATR
jgi:hypothetical protein